MSRVRIAFVLTCLAAVLLPQPPGRAAAFPGANGKIAYVAGDDLFTVDPDGANPVNLTNAPGLDVENLSASPDGKRIAFNVSSPTVLDDAGLYVVDVNGTVLRDVLAGKHDDFIAVGAPTWSPDGKRIAFEAYDYPGFRNELFVIDVDGGNLTRLTNCDCVSSSYPVWSPAGPEIAFVPCCSQVVTTINVNTKATAEVFASESGYVSNLTWSPDGTQIAYDDLIEVYRVAIPSGIPVPLTSTGPGYYSNPSWSPDGTKILVESNHSSQQSNNRDLYAIDAVQGVAGGVTRVTSALDAEGQPEWAPLCEARCTVTAITGLRVTKTKTAVKVGGRVVPAVTDDVAVALFKKTSKGWKRLRALDRPAGAQGAFAATFPRPSGGRCKVEARYAGDADHEPSTAVKTFAC